MSSCAATDHVAHAADRSRMRRGAVLRAATAALLAVAAVLFGAPAKAAPAQDPCPAGAFCAWPEENFTGERHDVGLQTTTMEQCVPLRQDVELRSFVNNTGHPVTVYQDPYCDTQADFATFPSGSQMPRSTYVARAIRVWPR
ncbi:hypothetical protein GCM10011581_02290 [Saccharopolyspora subtropica]|uniref:Peptidase inhibitor family I36 n=1 Tax=Saccharopolyspora thermophila TaxID=89367 RepID=A0A917N613_9PSEU|nr:hypothetical protein GCM10011581_02290 [Saccharopolyspora subtropica]